MVSMSFSAIFFIRSISPLSKRLIFVVLVFRNFSAEGGCFLKPAGKSTWESQIQEGSDMQWRKKVMEVKCHDYILFLYPLLILIWMVPWFLHHQFFPPLDV